MDNLSTKRILITGGLGYIGSETFKVAKEYSENLLAVDKLADVFGNVLSLDLKDAAKTSEIIINFKPDVIIHCATHSALAYRDHLLNSFQEDFFSTVNILNALAKMPNCRLIYLSSSYVYSGLTVHQNYDEYSALAPRHNFGIAKSFFEQFILKIHPNTVIFRLCSVFGSGQALHPNVILAFAEECLKNHSLTVWGKGERKLQYIYIKDVISIILRSFDLVGGIYNLGGDDYISTKDTAENIAKFFKVKVNFLENKPEGETLPFLSNQKIKDNLKNDLFTSFSIALNEYLKSLRII